MEENKKVYIRGVKDRGNEVIQKLVDLGGENVLKLKGHDEDLFYFIDLEGKLFNESTESFNTEDRTEIFLDEEPKENRREGWNEAFKKASENGSDENLYESNEPEYTVSYIAEAEKSQYSFDHITEEMFELWQRKNKDYGDSFSKGFEEYGMVMPCIRLEDKLLRFKQLVKNGNAEVKTESIEDTLIDLANYAVMTLMEIRKK